MAEELTGGTDDRPLVLDELAERLERFAALRDTDSATVALYAIVLTVVAGLVVPLGVVYVTTRL